MDGCGDRLGQRCSDHGTMVTGELNRVVADGTIQRPNGSFAAEWAPPKAVG